MCQIVLTGTDLSENVIFQINIIASIACFYYFNHQYFVLYLLKLIVVPYNEAKVSIVFFLNHSSYP